VPPKLSAHHACPYVHTLFCSCCEPSRPRLSRQRLTPRHTTHAVRPQAADDANLFGSRACLLHERWLGAAIDQLWTSGCIGQQRTALDNHGGRWYAMRACKCKAVVSTQPSQEHTQSDSLRGAHAEVWLLGGRAQRQKRRQQAHGGRLQLSTRRSLMQPRAVVCCVTPLY
jgi:hypothetical protein